MKKVKILMPAFNSEKTIGKTLQTLINQTYRNFEIFVVDNCSTDNTRSIVEGFKDHRIHFLSHNQNVGNYGNFDRCLSLAGGDYTAIFHSDDLYEETILEEQVALLNARAEVGAVFTEAKQINSRDEFIGTIKVPALLRLPALIKGVAIFDFLSLTKGFFRYNCFLICPTFMFRPLIGQSEIGRTYPELFDTAADVDVWMRIAQKWKVAVILKPLIKYRISEFQHSHQINDKRIKRSDFVWIINFYRRNFKDLFGNSRIDIKRTKLIDLVIRFKALPGTHKNYKKLQKIILLSTLDFRLLVVARWWKYFLIFYVTILSRSLKVNS